MRRPRCPRFENLSGDDEGLDALPAFGDTYSHLLPSEKDVIKDFFDGLNDVNPDGDSEDE
ncbi:MAG: hypothetical protein IJS52_04695 [Bacilli bacterium]|nr:hypothetical protein [Bacilli bacterium]